MSRCSFHVVFKEFAIVIVVEIGVILRRVLNVRVVILVEILLVHEHLLLLLLGS